MQPNRIHIIENDNATEKFLLQLIIIIHGAAIFFSDIIHMISLQELLCLGLLVLYYVITRRKIILSKFALPWFLYVIMVFLNIFIGAESRNYVLSFLLFTMVFYGLMRVPNAGIYMLKTIQVFTCIHLIASLAVYLLPHTVIDPIFQMLLGARYNSNYHWRVISNYNAGLTTQPGINAIYLTTGFLVYYARFLTEKKHKLRHIVMLMLFVAMILTTGKRSTVLFLPVTVVICTAFLTAKRKISTTRSKILFRIISVAFIAAIAVFWLNNTNLLDVLISKMDTLDAADDSSNGRFALWGIALNEYWSHPVFGIGLKSIYNKIGLDVHNTYIQILTEMGTLGFAAFLIGLFGMLKEGYRQLKQLKTNFISADNQQIRTAKLSGIFIMVFLLLYGLVGNTFIDYLPLMEFYMAVILMCSYSGT